MNWALQLNIDQSKNAFNSHLEKHFNLVLPSQPNSLNKPIEDRTGQPVTQEIVGKLQGELSSSDRAGQPAKEGEKRVLKNPDRTRKPVEASSHKVQEDGLLKIVILHCQTRTSSTL